MAVYKVHSGMTAEQKINYTCEFQCREMIGHKKYDLLFQYFLEVSIRNCSCEFKGEEHCKVCKEGAYGN